MLSPGSILTACETPCNGRLTWGPPPCAAGVPSLPRTCCQLFVLFRSLWVSTLTNASNPLLKLSSQMTPESVKLTMTAKSHPAANLLGHLCTDWCIKQGYFGQVACLLRGSVCTPINWVCLSLEVRVRHNIKSRK